MASSASAVFFYKYGQVGPFINEALLSMVGAW